MGLLDRAARFIDDVLLPDEVRSEIEQAEDALRRGWNEQAERVFRELVATRPSSIRARHGLALSLEARGDLRAAQAVVATSRQLDPDEPETALLAARLALALGDLDAAATEARDAARRWVGAGGPRFAEACLLRARVERRRGRPDRAARELRKAVAADGEDAALRLELAEVLAQAGQGAQAAAVARVLESVDLDDEDAARLGLALRAAGEGVRARRWLAQASASGHVEALQALARSCAETGDDEDAELHARTAIARGGGASALVTLADVLLSTGREAEAAEALLAASGARGEDAALLRRVAQVAPLDDAPTLAAVAARLGALATGDEAARAARLWSELAAGRDPSGEPSAAEPREEPRLALALALVALRSGRPKDALAFLARDWAFAKQDVPRARSLRRAALAALWRGPSGEVDLAAAIDEVSRFALLHGLDAVHLRARALRDELDRPLLLAVLGEFNAGKSTLINAFVGADVAPTGILPTTATLNLLRGGAERCVRVVRRDGTTRDGDYGQLKRMLADAEHDGIDRVEIVLPSELLERVWILDTPGSNAPVPEHEALAAEALLRADAALWIFDAGQAGKATEGRVFASMRASRRHVVAALNKVDRLQPGQLQEIQAALVRDLSDLGSEVVPLSARQALKARLAGDAEQLEASGFSRLLERLEQDVFLRARALKRRACGGRLLRVLDEALESENDAVSGHEARADELNRGDVVLRELGRSIADVIDAVLRELELAQERAFDEAADEVLAFVRPRAHRFAKHGADPEDRAFLGEVIEARLVRAMQACEARLLAAIRAQVAAGLPSTSVLGQLLDRRLEGAVSVPIARFQGYQAGALAGGGLRRFFEHDLPRSELDRASLSSALQGLRVQPAEHLRPALQEALQTLLAGLEAERRTVLAEARGHVDRLRERVFEPLRVLRDVLSELVG